MRWKLSKKGDFDIRSFYNKLRSPSPITFPWKGIWKVKAPPRVSFFVWTAGWEKIPTGDNLRGRGFDFVDWCIMCHCSGETVWMSRKGLEWILACFADIRDWVPGKDFLCKRFRANNKFFEFRGRSNKAGIFVEIAVYFGGARRGWVLVPASSNRSGWRLFSKELDSFLSGSNSARVVGRSPDLADGGGPSDGGGQYGKQPVNIRNQRNLRKFEFPRAVSGNNVLKGVSGASVSSKNGRPMRDFTFEVTSATLALRVSVSDGNKRVVKWINPYPQHRSINTGPVLFNIAPGLEKAHLADPISKAQHKSINTGPVLFNIAPGLEKAHLADPNTKAHGEVSGPFYLGASGLVNQNVCVVGESSKPLMESSVPSALPEAPTVGGSSISSSDQDSELLVPIPSRALGYPVAGKASSPCGSSDAVVLDSISAGFSMGSVSDAETTLGLGIRDSGSTGVMVGSSATAEIMVHNRFSPLSDLGIGVEDEFVVRDDLVEDQWCHHHAHRTRQRSVVSVGDFQSVSGLHLSPWESSVGSDHSGGSGEKDFCVLECDPLSRWETNDLRELVLVQDSTERTQVMESGSQSNWVSQLMKNFCNMVGFPIVKHEAQCLALFRLLEQECLKVIDVGVPKRPANTGSRGLRELKGLISNVNYEGVSSRSRSRVSSTAIGVVGSCK
nr:uncharacterized protein LOC112038539 [Quercus suber]